MEPRIYYLVVLLLFNLIACNSKNGNSKASTIIPLVKEKTVQEDFKIFSEPGTEKVTIVFRSLAAGNAMLSIFYSDGKYLEQRQLTVNKGMNTWDSHCQFKSSGIYIVKFKMDSFERSARIFKTGS